MELRDLIRQKDFLEKIAQSVHNVICANFSHITPAEKEDIEQEVKLKMLALATSGKKIRNLRSYIWKVIYTTTLDVIKERGDGPLYEKRHEFNDSIPFSQLDLNTPEAAAEKRELAAFVESAVAELPRRRRIVLKLHLQEMSLEEISGFLGWSQNKVRHLLYRGIADLKKQFLANKSRESKDATMGGKPLFDKQEP